MFFDNNSIGASLAFDNWPSASLMAQSW